MTRNPAMVELALRMERRAVDEKIIMERRWRATLAPKPQLPCDDGLFSDAAGQTDLVEMLR